MSWRPTSAPTAERRCVQSRSRRAPKRRSVGTGRPSPPQERACRATWPHPEGPHPESTDGEKAPDQEWKCRLRTLQGDPSRGSVRSTPATAARRYSFAAGGRNAERSLVIACHDFRKPFGSSGVGRGRDLEDEDRSSSDTVPALLEVPRRRDRCRSPVTIDLVTVSGSCSSRRTARCHAGGADRRPCQLGAVMSRSGGGASST
jgi:hypothetical protein